MYRNNDGTIPVMKFLNNSHKKIRAKFEFMMRYISDDKNILCEPYVKHFSVAKYKMLYELRLRAAGVMVRIIFYKTDDSIILFHAFLKRDRKDTENALEHSLKILNALDKTALYPTDNLVEVRIN